MNVFKIDVLNHFRAVQQCLSRYQAEATLNFTDFVLQVRARNRYYSFFPQFFGVVAGEPRYTRELDHSTKGFSGWLPYFNKRWPIGSGKFAFKEFCAANGLRTPTMWRSPSAEMRDFLVKHNNASFGMGLRGPFKANDPRDPDQVIDQQGYYEAFLEGRILKATYWDGRLACVELRSMATVKGNGKSSMRQLIAATLRPDTPEAEWKVYTGAVAYQGLALDAVPGPEQSVMIDFRYGSYSNALEYNNANAVKALAGSPVLDQLVHCGAALWRGIPESIRPATLFTVDAIADARDQVWLLEMNCNPVCHPEVYSLIFETLFGAAESVNPIEAPPPASALPDPSMPTARFLQPAGAPATMRVSRPYPVC